MDQEVPDWTGLEDHIEGRANRKGQENETNILTSWANEAWVDPARVVLDPDETSRSGESMRTIGWSESAGFLISVIAFRDEEGRLKGATAFRSSKRDTRRYESDEPQEA